MNLFINTIIALPACLLVGGAIGLMAINIINHCIWAATGTRMRWNSTVKQSCYEINSWVSPTWVSPRQKSLMVISRILKDVVVDCWETPVRLVIDTIANAGLTVIRRLDNAYLVVRDGFRSRFVEGSFVFSAAMFSFALAWFVLIGVNVLVGLTGLTVYVAWVCLQGYVALRDFRSESKSISYGIMSL